MTRSISSLDAILLTARGVMLETIRRKDLYVLLLLCLIYVMGMLVTALVGVESKATIIFLLNLGITFAWLSSHLLVILTAARQIPEEVENRTIHPLLAKPLRRSDYLIGKWVACTGSGILTFVALLILSSFPRLFLRVPLELSGLLYVQAFTITLFSLGMIAAVALFLSIVVPKPVNIVSLLLVLVFGQKAINMGLSQVSSESLRAGLQWILSYIPNFAQMNLFDRYTDGMEALALGQALGLLVYGLLFTLVPLVAAVRIFNRRPL